MIQSPLPLLGFSAFSGTGKTTLLRQLIPILKDSGLRIAIAKHAHHSFDIDHPGKDSYELRKAGADQVLVASRNRIAWVMETADEQEPVLSQVIRDLQPATLDLILVEGFKKEPFPKIELHRPSLGKELLFPNDSNIIALATDAPVNWSGPLPLLLDLNDPQTIAGFILQHIATRFRQVAAL
jgi:molybdopterin-guanine dinucleotide biosynthesis protein MobB